MSIKHEAKSVYVLLSLPPRFFSFLGVLFCFIFVRLAMLEDDILRDLIEWRAAVLGGVHVVFSVMLLP